MTINNKNQAKKMDAPLGIIIVSILILISSVFTFLMGAVAPINFILGILGIISAVYIRKMDKTGLYLYTGLVIFPLFFILITLNNPKSSQKLPSIIIQIIILIYLWTKREKFK